MDGKKKIGEAYGADAKYVVVEMGAGYVCGRCGFFQEV